MIDLTDSMRDNNEDGETSTTLEQDDDSVIDEFDNIFEKLRKGDKLR